MSRRRRQTGIAGRDGTTLNAYPWLHWCPYLTPERWEEECRLVEERLSLFFSFVEMPFLGFRGVVSRGGTMYRVMIAADMDMYPALPPSIFVTPTVPARVRMGRCVSTSRGNRRRRGSQRLLQRRLF